MFGNVGRAIRAQVRDAGSCDGLFFSKRLSTESVRFACERLQHEFRDRIFSPGATAGIAQQCCLVALSLQLGHCLQFPAAKSLAQETLLTS